MLRFNTYFSLITLLMLSSWSCSAKVSVTLKAKGYIVTASQNNDSKEWAKYAFKELQKTTVDKSIIELFSGNTSKDYKVFHFEVDPKLKSDYYIRHNIDTLHILIRAKQNKKWMLNQLIETLGQEDDHFDVSSLPPATVQFKTSYVDFDFAYRDPHYQSNLKPGNSQLSGNNNVDIDWGI